MRPAVPAGPGPQRRLGRRDRLRASREFRRVSRRGRRFSSRSFVLLVAPRETAPAAGRQAGQTETLFARIGLTVSRRVGGAVVRNRVKRRLREWFRTSTSRAAGPVDLVVIARPSAAGLSSEAMRQELDSLCAQALAGASA